MEKLTQEKINTLTSIVMEMSQFELKVALISILNGAEIDYSIDNAFDPKRSLVEKKV